MSHWTYLLAAFLSLTPHVLAGDSDWLSPIYTEIFQNRLPIPPTKEPKHRYVNATTGRVIRYYEVEIKPFTQQVYKNLKPANLVGYDGISPGPTFRMERGEEAVVRFINHGTMDNSVHLHGSYSRAPFDGWAEDVTKPGEYKDYYYPNNQKARTLWYHDHAVAHTAENAYYGQAGFYILHDPAEDSLGLPTGPYDVPLGLSAKQYKKDGDLFSPKDERVSLYGDVIHVNGQPWPYLEVEPRKYRFRLLDSSISRAFQLYLEDSKKIGTKIPFKVIGSDAGLLAKTVTTSTLDIAMAERWDIVVDFAPFANKNVTMRNNRDVQADEDYNSTDKIMQFVVGGIVKDTSNNGEPPSSLSTLKLPTPKTGVDRTFRFERNNGEWQVNGVPFSDVKNRILAKPPRGATEIWQLENNSGGWSHPVHIHLVDFQIISRTGGKRPVLPYEAQALKDVVLLGTNEKVQVLARYSPWDGVYMFHCHNLIHEDHDMMSAFNVSSLPDWGYSETTKFIDPMEQRWRSKKIEDRVFEEEHIMKELLPGFSGLDAYDADGAEKALDEYYKDDKKSSSAATSVAPSAQATSNVVTPASATTPGSTLSTVTTKATTSSSKATSSKTSSSSASTKTTSTKK